MFYSPFFLIPFKNPLDSIVLPSLPEFRAEISGFTLIPLKKVIQVALLDVRQLISVDDVQEDEELILGPNGALVFCMEYLVENLDWLHEQLSEGDDDYFLFDCPGIF